MEFIGVDAWYADQVDEHFGNEKKGPIMHEDSKTGEKFSVTRTYCSGGNPDSKDYQYGGVVTDMATKEEFHVKFTGDKYTCFICNHTGPGICKHADIINLSHPYIREGYAKAILIPQPKEEPEPTHQWTFDPRELENLPFEL